MLTNQEAFDKALKAMRKQNALSLEPNEVDSESTTSAYRNYQGEKCAIGHLIPDAMFDKITQSPDWNKVNCETALSLVKFYPEVKDFLPSEDFTMHLQQCHDFASGMSSFEDKMKNLAERFNLKYTS